MSALQWGQGEPDLTKSKNNKFLSCHISYADQNCMMNKFRTHLPIIHSLHILWPHSGVMVFFRLSPQEKQILHRSVSFSSAALTSIFLSILYSKICPPSGVGSPKYESLK